MTEFNELARPYFETLSEERLSEEAIFALAALQRILTAQSETIIAKDLQLEKANDQAFTDALTGLGNRRAFDNDLKTLADDLLSTGDHRDIEPLESLNWMIILGDLDNFKLVNDVLGYEIGDYTLASIAKLLQQSVRHSDKLYRLGGDELAIFVPVIPGKELSAFQAITKRFFDTLDQLRSNSEISSEVEALQAIDVSFASGLFPSFLTSVEDLESTVAETMRRVKDVKEAKGGSVR